ncbi:MAG: uracil-DNA glycosylase [Hyphomicrobiaceae bacterium]|nr:uracil-DNA glycosylase [Hyphomicrobiaceae bacterium]
MSASAPEPNLMDLLAWYGELGIDTFLSDKAIDWSERGDTPPGASVRAALRARAAGLGADDVPATGAPHKASGGRPGTTATPGGPSTSSPRPEVPARKSIPAPLPATSRAGSGKASAGSTAAKAAATAARSPAPATASLAAGANTLDELAARLAAFEGCPLKATAKSTCVFRGAATARLMIIGEAPGRDEDIAGKPFVGRAGQLLDRMLAAIAMGEDDVHITNTVYWRPPGNRTPTPQETEACRPFVERQIALVGPEVVLALGGVAAKAIIGTGEGIMRARGKWQDVTLGGHAVRAIASLHPAYLLRTPAAKRLAWRDLLAVRAALLRDG